MGLVSCKYNFKKIRTIKLSYISYFLLEFKGNYLFYTTLKIINSRYTSINKYLLLVLQSN